MVTFEEAKKTAQALKKGINYCREYETAWEFDDISENNDGSESVVILKDTGKAVAFTWFVMHGIKDRYVDPVDDVIKGFDC